MKKLFAFIMIISIIFLCGCNGKTPADGTAATTALPSITDTTAPQTTAKVIISEWNSDLLPERFPSPPKGAYGYYEETDTDKTDKNYHEGRVFVGFTCAEPELHNFANEMIKVGYIGGFCNIKNGTYYSDGYKGYWQDGKNIISIIFSSVSTNGDVTVLLEIVPCIDNFPEPLKEFYPAFNGYSVKGGNYCAHDASGEHFESEFENGFAPQWHWDFRFKNGFIGVTLDEFEDYYTTLGEMDFSGVITSSDADGCNILMVDVTKKIDGRTYGVYMLFNQTIRTLDIVYTNEPSLINAEG